MWLFLLLLLPSFLPSFCFFLSFSLFFFFSSLRIVLKSLLKPPSWFDLGGAHLTPIWLTLGQLKTKRSPCHNFNHFHAYACGWLDIWPPPNSCNPKGMTLSPPMCQVSPMQVPHGTPWLARSISKCVKNRQSQNSTQFVCFN